MKILKTFVDLFVTGLLISMALFIPFPIVTILCSTLLDWEEMIKKEGVTSFQCYIVPSIYSICLFLTYLNMFDII
jgi:hypothetical protein